MPLKTLSLYETLHDVERIARVFGVEGTMIEGGAFGNGLINDTLAATFEHQGNARRFILQRINHEVFRDPHALMHNVERVCEHVRTRLEADAEDDINRRCLTLLRTPDGGSLHRECDRDGADSYWRGYTYINHCTSYDTIQTADQAYEAARKFGEFQRLVEDLPGGRLAETIPDFHNTPKRFAALQQAVKLDPLGRAASCHQEISFALSHAPVAWHLLDLHKQGLIPERIIHNDTKLSNVLIDDVTGRGMCVVDLDTVMPGLALYDFGDLVRTCVSPAEEDSTDLSRIEVRLPVFQALARGYIEEMGTTLTDAETANLAFSGRLLTFEVALRFLTDHLLGDIYFGAKRPNHNLERARNQFHLFTLLGQCEAEMDAYVDSLARTADRSARFSTRQQAAH